MLFDRRRLITYALVVAGDPGRALLRAAGARPASRTRCARSRTPIPSGSRSRSASTCCRSPPTSRSSAASSAAASVSPQVRERIDWRTSYQITLAGLAATRLFSAGGAGGIALTYWALRRAGMGARQAASRMVAFLVLLYTVYLLALVICGIFLRVGLFPGPSPVGMTIVPAGARGRRADHPVPAVADPARPRSDRGALGAGPPARADGAAHRERARRRSRRARARR